jgi:hypothetical protein
MLRARWFPSCSLQPVLPILSFETNIWKVLSDLKTLEVNSGVMAGLYLEVALVCLNHNQITLIMIFVYFGFILLLIPVFKTFYCYLLSWSMPEPLPLNTSISRSSVILLLLLYSPKVLLIVLLTGYTL